MPAITALTLSSQCPTDNPPQTASIALIRFSATQQTLYSHKMKDWTSIYMLYLTIPVDDSIDTLRAYGTDIMEENLLFACEETRYSTFFDKKSCFSKCGCVVASPDKKVCVCLPFRRNLTLQCLQGKHCPQILTGPRCGFASPTACVP